MHVALVSFVRTILYDLVTLFRGIIITLGTVLPASDVGTHI